MPVYIDDDVVQPGIPGGAGAGTLRVAGAGARVFVLDDLDIPGSWSWASAPLYADIALTLVYDSVLSRVRITATGMEVFTLATVERSTDQLTWTTVRGGETVSVAAGTLKLDDYEFAANVTNYYRVRTLVPFGQSTVASITPTLTSIWLKSVARPYLNLTISAPLGDTFTFERPHRSGVFNVVGRSLPVAITDVRGSRQYVLKVRTDTDDGGDALDLLLASGDILFLHAPPGSVVPTGGVFLSAGRTEAEYPNPPDPMRFTSIPVTEVAAPGPDVVGATSSWQTVINTYADWNAVIAAKATWSELLDLVGNASDVIVP